MIDNNYSLLTREESNAIKGILILLVVLGHNSVLMKHTGMYEYIYSFHVYCFFILPFLYGYTQSGETFAKRFQSVLIRSRKNYIIYLILSLICLGISIFLGKVIFSPANVIYAITTGSQNLLIKYVGFGMLWFLPTICAILFWHQIYYTINTKYRYVFLLTTFVLWILAALGITNYHEIGLYVPFALAPGLYHVLTGVLSRKLITHQRSKSNIVFKIIISAFFILFFVYKRYSLPFSIYYLTWLLCPIAAMFILYHLRTILKRIKILIMIGRYSFGIYLLHIFIYNGIYRCVVNNSLLWGLILFVITVIISFVVTVIFNFIARNIFKNKIWILIR